MLMTAIEKMANSFKIRNAFSSPLLRASAIVPKHVMKVINSIPGIAQVLTSHTGRVPMGMIEKLRFSTKIIAIMTMAQAFTMAALDFPFEGERMEVHLPSKLIHNSIP